jgi:hypothetical protein
MSQKTIQFNPVFLSMSGSKSSANKTLKREKKEKPLITMNPNKVKKQLIEKIKTFQLKEKENDVKEKTKEEEEKINIEKEFNNEFNNSVKFLEELSKNQKEKSNNKINRKKNKTLKAGKIENEIKMQIETELPPEMKIPFKSSYSVSTPQASAQQTLAPQAQVSAPQAQVSVPQAQVSVPQAQVSVPQAQVSVSPVLAKPVLAKPVLEKTVSVPPVLAQPPAPQYSNLKNSVLPTFRQWKNSTQKNYNPQQEKPSIKIDDYEKNIEQSQRSIALETIKNKYNENKYNENKYNENKYNTENTELTEEIPIINNDTVEEEPIINKKRRHRITKTRKYTLGRTGSKVSVLIKNAKTRKLVQHELALLRQKGIPEIKTFLRKKNLLKVGSDAPNDVLRQIYEQSVLSGDVENKAKDVLIHNYMNH